MERDLVRETDFWNRESGVFCKGASGMTEPAEEPMSDGPENRKIVLLPIASLKPYAGNPRRHSAKQIRQIADSIRRFGFTNPILIDADGVVVAGHGRLEAGKLLGLDQLPTICLDQMTEAQRRAYVITDNSLPRTVGGTGSFWRRSSNTSRK